MGTNKNEISNGILIGIIISTIISSAVLGIISGSLTKEFIRNENYSDYNEQFCNEIIDELIPLLKDSPPELRLKIYFEFIRQMDYHTTGKIDFYVKTILHDSGQYNYFIDYSNLFNEIWISNNSQTEVELCLKSLRNWFGYYQNIDLLASEVHNHVLNLCEYRYDDLMMYGISPHWNYSEFPQFPFETAFSRHGDCEDQAILDSMLLESCGYETIIAFVSDNNKSRTNRSDGLHHGFLWIKINPEKNWSARLWRFGEGAFEWLLLDPTWDFSFGSEVSWIATYNQQNFSEWDEILHWGVVGVSNDSSLVLNDSIPEQEPIRN